MLRHWLRKISRFIVSMFLYQTKKMIFPWTSAQKGTKRKVPEEKSMGKKAPRDIRWYLLGGKLACCSVIHSDFHSMVKWYYIPLTHIHWILPYFSIFHGLFHTTSPQLLPTPFEKPGKKKIYSHTWPREHEHKRERNAVQQNFPRGRKSKSLRGFFSSGKALKLFRGDFFQSPPTTPKTEALKVVWIFRGF